MSMTFREIWTSAHGMIFGALFLLAFAGGLAGLYSMRPALLTAEGLQEPGRTTRRVDQPDRLSTFVSEGKRSHCWLARFWHGMERACGLAFTDFGNGRFLHRPQIWHPTG